MPTKKKPALPVDNLNEEVLPVEEEVTSEVSKPAKKTAQEETAAMLPPVIFESVDGRKLTASVGRFTVEGRRIEVPRELEGEVERLLREGHYLFTKIA